MGVIANLSIWSAINSCENSKSRTFSRLDKTSISLISGLFDISEDVGGKVLQLSEISSVSLIMDFYSPKYAYGMRNYI